MAEQTEPSLTPLAAISDRETLLRRVPPSYYPNKEVPNKPAIDAFLPRRWVSSQDPGDSTGLSVDREWFTTIDSASRHPDTGKPQNVARTSVEQIGTVGLSAIANERPSNRSHTLIPELNSLDYKNNKEKKAWIKTTARKIAMELCEMAFICPTSESPPRD